MNEAPAARLQQEKEQARALLAEGYAQDWIDQGELDRRMEAVERATAIEEVRALTTELRPVESTALVPAASGSPQALRVLLGSLERAGAWTIAPQTRVKVTLGSAVLDLREAVLPPGSLEVEVRVLLGSLERAGAWTIAARTRVAVTLGSAVLDLRQATLPPGPLEVEVRVLCGSLEIVVPPGWQIENHCGAVLAAVEQGRGSQPTAGRVLRLTGRVVLGSLAVLERELAALPAGRAG